MARANVLELRPPEGTFLKNVLEVLSDLFSEADFDFSRTGLEVRAVDTSGVAFVVLELRAKAFERYICNRDHFFVGLNLAAMAKAFSFANNDDIITITSDNDGFEIVTIKLESPKGNVIKHYDLDFDVPNKIPEHTESEYQAIVRMPCARFIDSCNEVSSYCDTRDGKTAVRISVYKDCVNFSPDGGPIIFCPQIQNVDKTKEATHIEMKEKVSLTFGMRYINSLSKACTLSDQVTIKFSSNQPAVFEYKIKEMGCIRYYIMPAKEDETQGMAKDGKMQNEGDEMQN